jgi:hypothetical protein
MKKIASVFLLVFLAVSCKKNQPLIGEPKDLCECLKEQRSSFFMGEKFGSENINLDTIIMPVNFSDGNPANFDSINSVYVYFEANYKDALSYTWQVGSNSTSQSTASFGLYFNTQDDQIPVTLITTSTPNPKCIPNDTGQDTIVRYLTIKNELPHPMWGSYYGATTDNPNDLFTIEIDTMTRYFSWLPGNLCGEVIKNLPNGKIHPISFNRDFGSLSYCFEGIGDVSAPYDDIIHVGQPQSLIFNQNSRGIYDRLTGEIRITYFTREIITPFQLGGDYIEHTFIGQKL